MSDKIKFIHAENGELIENNGSTVLADIFTIGAIQLAAKRNFETQHLEYATDLKGLEAIAEKTEYVSGFLNDSISSIGILLAHIDHAEIETEMPTIGWLIAGLSELSRMTTETRADINRSIQVEYKAKLKLNAEEG